MAPTQTPEGAHGSNHGGDRSGVAATRLLRAALGGTLTLLSLAQAADLGSRLGYSY